MWGLGSGNGDAEFINNDEIDCVCRTEELIHLIECTTERTMQKFRDQVQKLKSAKAYLEGQGDTVKLRIVTLSDPSPQQKSNARGNGVTALSLEEFKRGLIESRQYLEARWKYRFGSASDPNDGSFELPEEEYIEQPLMPNSSEQSYSVEEICQLLREGSTIVLFGPFGAGKSLTVREVFRHLRRDFHRSGAGPTPVALNLRDHWGQQSISEILQRHSEKIGFEKPNQLVRAWNAGQLIPLLDGVDELASPVMPIGQDAIRRSREEALKVIQAFMHDARGRTGVLITGRDHYFDSLQEARRLMRLPNDTIFVDIGEFSEEQATEYLRKKQVHSNLPAWLPRKPLLLGYLASQDLLGQVAAMQGDSGPAMAWDYFLDKICERESDWSSDIDSPAIRRLLEDLAARARSLPRGSGPLYDGDLSEAYKSITGYEPLEAARTLLQRLPGLTARDQEVGARSFVDDEMMEALNAGAVVRYIINPFERPTFNSPQHPLKAFGCSVAGHLASARGVNSAQFGVAGKEAIHRWAEPTLSLDAILSGVCSPETESLELAGLTINGALADEIDMEETSIKGLTLDNCLINRVHFDGVSSDIKFRYCHILRVEGIANSRALPATFEGCEVQEFDNRHTNNAIIASELPNSMKMLLIIVRKLFLQRGSGRAESALYRGIDAPLRPYVSPVLDLLVSNGIAYSHPTGRHLIWHGNRIHRPRMLKILEAPMNSNDPIVREISQITSR